MKKLKCLLESCLFLCIVFLTQKLVFFLYSFFIFHIAENENSFVSKKYFSKMISIEEKALSFIESTNTLYIFIGWIIGIGIILIAYKVAKQKPIPDFRNRMGFVNILLSMIVGFGMVLLINGLVYGLSDYFDFERVFREQAGYGGQSFFRTILLVGLLTPIFEEIVFRGFIMGKLFETGSKTFAVFLQAILFSVSHFNIIQGLSVFLLGLIAGYGVMKTKSLGTGMMIHIVFNIANLYWFQNGHSIYDIGQWILFVGLGITLTYFGMEKLRRKITPSL